MWGVLSRLLCEVHEEYQTNIALAKNGFWVYDFALPLLLLHAVTFKTAVNIRQWLRICPRRQITVLDTHDGMGIDDIEGIAQVLDMNIWSSWWTLKKLQEMAACTDRQES